MPSLILCVLIGGGFGAALGSFGKYSPGIHALTTSWWRGAIYGALVGVVFYVVTGVGSPAAMNRSTPNVTHITGSEFEAAVIDSVRPVVVDFYATWCGPCKVLSPQLDKLAGSFTNEIKFVKVNVDESPAVSQRFNIQAVPTLLFFKNGKVVDSVIGLVPSDTLKARLRSLGGTSSSGNGSN